ncbi:hypothetical protein Moror_16636 [Moniliophthora roreri MCA 2997]|uniref:Uncharacterized protein n=1 Tax=Moniliophthora roreri (strain MCA 2997) TaxID=1381753 RepID=V2X0F5_MONRO|nr:hypothetical protein Moror_16636 [Moniliophthora roreri MCA 2997]
MPVIPNLNPQLFLFALLSILAALRFTQIHEAFGTYFLSTLELPRSATLSGSLRGWHTRALSNPYPHPNDFTLSRNDIDIFSTRSSMVDSNGFTLAVFRDNESRKVVIDALGRVLVMSDKDYNLLVSLARDIAQNDDIPHETFWNIDHGGRSCLPGDTWYVKGSAGPRTYKVSGFSSTERKLEKHIRGFAEIPEVLHDFMNLTREALEGYYESEDWFANRHSKPASIRNVWSVFDPDGAPAWIDR